MKFVKLVLVSTLGTVLRCVFSNMAIILNTNTNSVLIVIRFHTKDKQTKNLSKTFSKTHFKFKGQVFVSESLTPKMLGKVSGSI